MGERDENLINEGREGEASRETGERKKVKLFSFTKVNIYI